MNNVKVKLKRILIVEDDGIIVTNLKKILTEMGYEVAGVAAFGEDVFDKVSNERPDLILMDIKLSGIVTGIEAASQVRAKFDIPVIYLTAFSDNLLLQEAKITEPYGYLVKPIQDRELHATIEMALYRHMMEMKLKESERWSTTTLQSIGDAVITTDTQSRVTFMNTVAERLTGWKKEEAFGRDITEVFHIVNEFTGMNVENPVTKVIREGNKAGLANHTLLIRKDGNKIPIDDSGAPIQDDKGSITGTVLVFRDITERQKMEERLRQAEKMEAIGQLAGGVAHDFNNQLQGILGYADLLINRLEDETLRRYADNILKISLRASDLAKQLLAFARKGKYISAPVKLHDVIHEVVGLLQHSIDKRIVIKQHLDAGMHTVMGDPAQLQNALLNLALNARDAMPGGGDLVFSTSVVYLTDQNYGPEVKAGQYLEVCVIDTGVGMSIEVQKHLFEPFFTTKSLGKGTGLGLASVYGTVKNHNGVINVHSEPGRGTSFQIYLPLVEDENEVENSEESSVSAKCTGRVLVAEDEDFVRAFLIDMLKSLGHEVVAHENGEAAVAYYRDSWQHIDLVILDLVMPKMGGRDTFLAMKKINPSVKALLSSGYSIEGEAQAILDEGVLGFIQKPYKMSELSHKVQKLLQTM